MSLFERVKASEGFRSHPYKDSRGVLTIGYGFNVDDTGPGLEADECDEVLRLKLTKMGLAVTKALPWADGNKLGPARFEVLVEMAYNLGLTGLLGFHRMLAMIEAGNFEGAAAVGLESKWAEQVGQRAKTLMEILRTGVDNA